MDISENQMRMIYSRKDLYEKQLEIIINIIHKKLTYNPCLLKIIT